MNTAPHLSLKHTVELLASAGLLHEAIVPDRQAEAREDVEGHVMNSADLWTRDPADLPDVEFSSITYDSRQVSRGGLLFCKGGFRPEYLGGADEAGLAAYVSVTPYTDRTQAIGIIVSDDKEAMALLAAEYYGRPQNALTVIGITGTKGKTTTAYFTQAILNAATSGKCALFSSVDNCIDGHTYEESQLTTPESLDLFRMMRDAVDAGMEYLVMEVSSQAYKVKRVFGLTFDIAAFLNISPDHVSPIEHPTFEDYFWCKRQIVRHAKRLVVGAGMTHGDVVAQDAQELGVPYTLFEVIDPVQRSGTRRSPAADVTLALTHPGLPEFEFASETDDAVNGSLPAARRFHLSMPGDFNVANAAAAIALAEAAGIPQDSEALAALENVTISGRMEFFQDSHDPNVIAYVDYAHNYASVTALLDFVYERYGERNPRITLVTGSAGNKAADRRRGIIAAAQDRIARLVLTSEDTDTEPMRAIMDDMDSRVTNTHLIHDEIEDRTSAIESAIAGARADAKTNGRLNVILAIGKGREKWIKYHNKHEPYESDTGVIARVFAQ